MPSSDRQDAARFSSEADAQAENPAQATKPGKLDALIAAARALAERSSNAIADGAIAAKETIDQALRGASVMVGPHGSLDDALARQRAAEAGATAAAKAEEQKKILPNGFEGAGPAAISFEEFKAKPVNQRSHVALKAVHLERGWNTSDADLWQEQWRAYRGAKK